MANPNCRNLSAVLWLVGTTYLASACKHEPKAGRAARALTVCAKACAVGFDATKEQRGPDCQARCVARVADTPARCESLLWDWLVCLGAATAQKGARCELEGALATRCEEACRNEGVLQSGELRIPQGATTSVVRYELYDCGCSHCALVPGAGAGAPCQSAKVCAERRLVCDSDRTFAKLRACVDDRCATDEWVRRLPARLTPGRNCRIDSDGSR
jgi:hypothetical protein